ncbi:hypothetical protein JT249_06030 [Helicobacter pylori]|nr:hypothetical protein [Helicobacter pylori]
MNVAQTGALIGGGVSAITNIYECIANGKDPMKALKHTLVATAKGGALSYGSAFASSSLGGLMQSSTNKIIQSLGKGSVPAMFVGTCVANATVLTRYFSGKIDKAELPIAGCAVKISPGLLSLLSLTRAMGCASFWI